MAYIMGAPSRYIQGKGELERLYMHIKPIAKNGVYVLVDAFVMEHYADRVRSSFTNQSLPLHLDTFGGECCQPEIERIAAALGSTGADVVVGVGGGKTLDAAKAAAHEAGVPVAVCPTVASSDAPCSALAVLYTQDGRFDRYLPLPQNPAVVLADTAVIASAPAKLLVAGMGDALSTYFEARACVRSGAQNAHGGQATQAAFLLAERCYAVLLADGQQAKVDAEAQTVSQAVEHVVEANIYLSGVGFESCGTAAAHAVHNGLAALPGVQHIAHGEKVAFGTVVQLLLENAPELGAVVSFCKQVGLPTCLADMGLQEQDSSMLQEAARLACAPQNTMGNMPFAVSAEDVYRAMCQTQQFAG